VEGRISSNRLRVLRPVYVGACLDADLRFWTVIFGEGGSRLVEAPLPLHYVQAMLGHASLNQS
jgi:hypothetical protein